MAANRGLSASVTEEIKFDTPTGHLFTKDKEVGDPATRIRNWKGFQLMKELDASIALINNWMNHFCPKITKL